MERITHLKNTDTTNVYNENRPKVKSKQKADFQNLGQIDENKTLCL